MDGKTVEMTQKEFDELNKQMEKEEELDFSESEEIVDSGWVQGYESSLYDGR